MLDAGIAEVVAGRTVAEVVAGRTVAVCTVAGDAVGSEDQEDPLGWVPHNLALAWEQVDIEDL